MSLLADQLSYGTFDLGHGLLLVSGAKGRPPTDTYKVSTTWPDGYKFSSIFMLGGREAVAKGRHSAESIIKKTRRASASRSKTSTSALTLRKSDAAARSIAANNAGSRRSGNAFLAGALLMI